MKKPTFKIHDVVVLLNDRPSDFLAKGAIGTVLEVGSGDVFLVEFASHDGEAYAIVELPAAVLVKVVREKLAVAA